MSTVALYTRCSTKQHGQDPETQLIPLREYARQLEIAASMLIWDGPARRNAVRSSSR